jgi:hypothetical protein
MIHDEAETRPAGASLAKPDFTEHAASGSPPSLIGSTLLQTRLAGRVSPERQEQVCREALDHAPSSPHTHFYNDGRPEAFIT